jgi:signal recognition particle receptor subunit beta
MAFVNFATKNLAIKIVYYGPGLSGKTTNLRYIYFKLDPSFRGEFVCLETDSERTFFFDLLPIKAGLIGDFKVHFQLMTVPGQAFYEASRKSFLKGADGVIFVGDSQIPLLDANLESFDGLRRNCLDHNIDLNQIPLVFQYNKRDLNYLIPVETFNNLLNPRRLPYVEAAAINGVGVFETLREIAKLTVPFVKERVLGEKRREGQKPELHEETFPEQPERGPLERAAEKGREDIEFVPQSQATPFQVTKIKMKSQKEIEEELEKISQEFGTKPK